VNLSDSRPAWARELRALIALAVPVVLSELGWMATIRAVVMASAGLLWAVAIPLARETTGYPEHWYQQDPSDDEPRQLYEMRNFGQLELLGNAIAEIIE
jgi:hypothetical protein